MGSEGRVLIETERIRLETYIIDILKNITIINRNNVLFESKHLLKIFQNFMLYKTSEGKIHMSYKTASRQSQEIFTRRV